MSSMPVMLSTRDNTLQANLVRIDELRASKAQHERNLEQNRHARQRQLEPVQSKAEAAEREAQQLRYETSDLRVTYDQLCRTTR